MKKQAIYFISILVLFGLFQPIEVFTQSAILQSKKFSDNWFLNANIGVSQFYGDMSDKNPIEKIWYETRVGTGITFGKMIIPALGFRGQLYYGQLKSSRKNLGPNGQYYISQNVVEGNIALVINFSNLIFK